MKKGQRDFYSLAAHPVKSTAHPNEKSKEAQLVLYHNEKGRGTTPLRVRLEVGSMMEQDGFTKLEVGAWFSLATRTSITSDARDTKDQCANSSITQQGANLERSLATNEEQCFAEKVHVRDWTKIALSPSVEIFASRPSS